MRNHATTSAAEQVKGTLAGAYAAVYTSLIGLHRPDSTHQAAICLCRRQVASSQALAAELLTAREHEYFAGLKFEKRRQSYLLGRYAAKHAVSALTEENTQEIRIGQGVFHNPLIESGSRFGRLDVSIAHSAEFGAAVVFPAAHPLGIDIEPVNRAKIEIIERELAVSERKLLEGLIRFHEQAVLLTAAWTIKEALSKVLRTGLMTPLSVYEIAAIEKQDNCYISHFTNFGQYKAISFLLHDSVCTIVCPKKTEPDLNLPLLLSTLFEESR